uniref:Peroxisomal catalase (EC) n=1 Tax=Ganoderma boninense TaxID=34458 RepID=A0A5K1JY29_9APHY|nr:Peroxisomal catalase (EC [Ganoderma boninense]
MFFALGSIAAAGLAALSTFTKTLMSESQKAPLNVQISVKLSSENVTIVSPQPLEVIGPQFDFKFVDTAYNLTVNNSGSAPLTVSLRNETFQVSLFPANIEFIPDSDPPTAEARMLVFTHPGLAEGPYNLSVGEFVWGGPLNSPTSFAKFDVPVEFSYDPQARQNELEAAAHEEL